MRSPRDKSDEPRNPRLLVADDDPEIGDTLRQVFAQRGYSLERATSGEVALQKITSLPPYDVVLLDVMLPDRNGFDVLREARAAGVDSPVIMLSVKNEHKHKIRAFDLEADDYVTKPFDVEELAARVEAVRSRSDSNESKTGPVYSFGNVTVHFPESRVTRNGEEIEFTKLELDILEYFVTHRGRTISRRQLLRDVWGLSGDSTRTIDRHVASLRNKIEPSSDTPTYIETVYGIGYKFVG